MCVCMLFSLNVGRYFDLREDVAGSSSLGGGSKEFEETLIHSPGSDTRFMGFSFRNIPLLTEMTLDKLADIAESESSMKSFERSEKGKADDENMNTMLNEQY